MYKYIYVYLYKYFDSGPRIEIGPNEYLGRAWRPDSPTDPTGIEFDATLAPSGTTLARSEATLTRSGAILARF